MTNQHLFWITLLGACGADVPANPTYLVDVQPILRANCARCHGADPTDPKIAKFRLDRSVKDDTVTFDAWDYAQPSGSDPAPILRVAVDHEAPAMPPDYSLDERQRQILETWIANGAPKGEGLRDNHLPQIALISPTGATTADQTLDTTFRAWDDDLDSLYVQLWAHDLATAGNATDFYMGPKTGGGQRQLSIDTGTLASKHNFEIYATLDDGYHDNPADNKTTVTLFGSLVVDHGIQGTAPRVVLLAPNGGETLIGSTMISWDASDPDTDPTFGDDQLTYDLDLIKVAADGTETVVASIDKGLVAVTPATYSWTIPSTIAATDGSGNQIPYKIRVTATDSLGLKLGASTPNVRHDESDMPLFIAQTVTTSYVWNDATMPSKSVRPVFDSLCKKCHAAAGKTVAIDYFCLLQYSGDPVDYDPLCESTDQGVFDVKGLVYQRMVVQKNMPPATEPKPTQAQIDMIGNWILGGAPKGTVGPSDGHPTLTWMAPDSTTVLDGRTTGIATLQWTDEDPEGMLKSDSLEYTKVSGTSASSDCLNVSCPPPTVSWKPLTSGTVSGMSQMRTFDWPTPTLGPTTKDQGCYCVRGNVTDAVNQTTSVIAIKPVKF